MAEAVRTFLALLGAGSIAVSAEEPWTMHVIDDGPSGADGVRLGDVNRDGLQDLVTGWEEAGITRVYLNPGPGKVTRKWPAVTVGKTPHVEDAMFVDLDSDGILDVVTCSEGNTKSIMVHWGPKNAGRILEEDAWTSEVLPAAKDRMRWMFAVAMQVDGTHGLDLVAAGKGSDAGLGWFEAPAEGRNLKDYLYHPMTPVGWVMSIRVHDMDGDGDRDVLLSDRKGSAAGVRWLENRGPGKMQAQPWENHLVARSTVEGTNYQFLDLGDLDGDGLEDVAWGSYADQSTIGIAWRRDRRAVSWDVEWIPLQSFGLGRAKAVRLGDLDRDGRLDVTVSCETADQKHGVAWFSHAGRFDAPRWTMHPVSGTARGIKFDRIELLDLDADGDLDLLTCEEHEGPGSNGLGVIWFENPTP